jgi:hypothetical protein
MVKSAKRAGRMPAEKITVGLNKKFLSIFESMNRTQRKTTISFLNHRAAEDTSAAEECAAEAKRLRRIAGKERRLVDRLRTISAAS